MKYEISKDLFVKALAKVQPVTSAKFTQPMLGNVKLEVAGNVLTVSATDLEVGVETSYTVTGAVDGAITVPSKKLYEIVRELPTGDVRFSSRDNDWVDIVSGAARFNLVGLPAYDYPAFPATEKVKYLSLQREALGGMISRIVHAVSFDETRYNLNGAYLEVLSAKDGGLSRLVMVATDGHRLALSHHDQFIDSYDAKFSQGVILPTKGLHELGKLAAEDTTGVLLGFQDNNLIALGGSSKVSIRLIDGEFPDYQRVIPADNGLVVTVEREKLLPALKRMAILPSEKTKGVRMDVTPTTMRLSSGNPEIGDANEDVEAVASAAISCRYNVRFLADAVANMGGSMAEIRLKDNLSPILVKAEGDDFAAVIMPMRM